MSWFFHGLLTLGINANSRLTVSPKAILVVSLLSLPSVTNANEVAVGTSYACRADAAAGITYMEREARGTGYKPALELTFSKTSTGWTLRDSSDGTGIILSGCEESTYTVFCRRPVYQEFRMTLNNPEDPVAPGLDRFVFISTHAWNSTIFDQGPSVNVGTCVRSETG